MPRRYVMPLTKKAIPTALAKNIPTLVMKIKVVVIQTSIATARLLATKNVVTRLLNLKTLIWIKGEINGYNKHKGRSNEMLIKGLWCEKEKQLWPMKKLRWSI